ncbi:hypothetical protein H4CHR_04365 [Variovorax sp. PBS-H4]|nr:hypothetical protein H4CHR_04365 [Variovorax sp. PBS-H4]
MMFLFPRLAWMCFMDLFAWPELPEPDKERDE